MASAGKSSTGPDPAGGGGAEPTLPREAPGETPRGALFDGRYRKRAVLGRGGFGEVTLVEDTLRRDQRLALKTILPEHARESEFALRFHREIDVLRALRHPGIPQIVNDGRTPDGTFYFTMEYVDGVPLGRVVEEDGPLAPLRLARITRQLAAILDYAHGQGVVHRDLKPANVLVSAAGTDEERVHVLDFGIAKLLESRSDGIDATEHTSGFIGTPEYASPEQVLGDTVDARSDAYALGILIHFLATGRTPFEGKSRQEIATKRLHTPPTPLLRSEAPREIRELVRSLLERDRERRPDPAAISRALDRVLEDLGEERRHGRRVGLWAAVATAAAVGLGVWAVTTGGSSAVAERESAAVARGERPSDAGTSFSGTTASGGTASGGTASGGTASGGSGSDERAGESGPKPVSPAPEQEAAAPGDAAESDADHSDADHTGIAAGRDEGAAPPAETEENTTRSSVAPEPLGDGETLGDAEPAKLAASEGAKPPDAPSGAAVASAPPARPPLALDLVSPGAASEVSAGTTSIEIAGRVAGGAAEVDRDVRVTVDGRDVALDGRSFRASVPLAVGTNRVTIEIIAAGEPAARETLAVVRRAPRLAQNTAPAPDTDYVGDLPRVIELGDARVRMRLVEANGAPLVYLGETEVTEAQFGLDPASRLPAVDVGTDAARAFAEGLGARLPTSAEWLAGALERGASGYPWGETFDPARCNARDGGPGRLVPVDDPAYDAGTSWCGLRHMSGNAAEWALEGDLPVALGGSFRSTSERCRSEKRAPSGLSAARPDIGFRLALTPPTDERR